MHRNNHNFFKSILRSEQSPSRPQTAPQSQRTLQEAQQEAQRARQEAERAQSKIRELERKIFNLSNTTARDAEAAREQAVQNATRERDAIMNQLRQHNSFLTRDKQEQESLKNKCLEREKGLQRANQELQRANKELQRANQELQIANQELQRAEEQWHDRAEQQMQQQMAAHDEATARRIELAVGRVNSAKQQQIDGLVSKLEEERRQSGLLAQKGQEQCIQTQQENQVLLEAQNRSKSEILELTRQRDEANDNVAAIKEGLQKDQHAHDLMVQKLRTQLNNTERDNKRLTQELATANQQTSEAETKNKELLRDGTSWGRGKMAEIKALTKQLSDQKGSCDENEMAELRAQNERLGGVINKNEDYLSKNRELQEELTRLRPYKTTEERARHKKDFKERLEQLWKIWPEGEKYTDELYANGENLDVIIQLVGKKFQTDREASIQQRERDLQAQRDQPGQELTIEKIRGMPKQEQQQSSPVVYEEGPPPPPAPYAFDGKFTVGKKGGKRRTKSYKKQ